MSRIRSRRAFTLIEVLVVVAIIALLVSVLIPSLDRARKQARMISCQSNLRMLTTAFLTYAAETKGFLPGNSESREADWLGLGNRNYTGRQPEDGTIFKRHMGRDKKAYRCPDDDQYRKDAWDGNRNYSYTTPIMMAGANTAYYGRGHYRFANGASGNFSETDHTTNMRPIPAFIIVEEDYDYFIKGANNSAWDNDDSISTRHLSKKGNVGCVDGHVEALALPLLPRTDGKFFGSRDMCVRYKSKWVSGVQWYDEFYSAGGRNPRRTSYRRIETCTPADDAPWNVRHGR